MVGCCQLRAVLTSIALALKSLCCMFGFMTLSDERTCQMNQNQRHQLTGISDLPTIRAWGSGTATRVSLTWNSSSRQRYLVCEGVCESVAGIMESISYCIKDVVTLLSHCRCEEIESILFEAYAYCALSASGVEDNPK